MEINRRTVLKSALSIPIAISSLSAWAETNGGYVTTGRADDGQYYAYTLDRLGAVIKRIALQDRGHGVAFNKATNKAILFARRPGRYALAFNPFNSIKTSLFQPPENRHFYGHGVFSADGALLFATENDFKGERGVIGVYNARNNFQRLGELNSGGIGPHEIISSNDGKTLIVANGGIATHPDYPREKLNLSDMHPNLSFIKIDSGDITHSVSLPKRLHQVSLRHLSIDRSDTVWIGGQYQGAKLDKVPLAFTFSQKSKTIEALQFPVKIQRKMKQYVGSVSVNNRAGLAALSAPRGNQVSLWNLNNKSLVKTISIIDGCGIAVHRDGFLVTSGQGQITSPSRTSSTPGVNWDNHITPI